MKNVHVLQQSTYLESVMTILRDRNTDRAAFRHNAELIGDLLIIEAINRGFIPSVRKPVVSPTGVSVTGISVSTASVVAVSIVRAGNALVNSVFRILDPNMELGQLVIQRDESTALPVTLLNKLPQGIGEAACVVVLDPMLATGGSVLAAIDVLLTKGVRAERVVLLHALGCPEGIAAITDRFPEIRAIIGVVDSHLNERKFIIPGLGDFGDRFFCP